MSENGESKAAETTQAAQQLSKELVQIVLLYNKMTGELQIASQEQNIDLQLVVVGNAYLKLEVAFRIAAGLNAQQQIAQHNKDAALAESLRIRW